jgi:chemotaxis protein MotB
MGLAAVVLLAAGTTGCQEEQLKAQVLDLQVRLRDAEAQNAALREELGDAQAKSAHYQAQAAAAQADAENARRQLAALSGGGATAGRAAGEVVTAARVAPVAEQTFTVPDPFTAGKATLKPAAIDELRRIATAIKRDYAGRMIRVEGHTDGDPIRKSGWKDNWELSCERAATVVRQLVSFGIPAENLYVAGYGEHRPVADNKTAVGKSKNRRIEIVVMSR